MAPFAIENHLNQTSIFFQCFQPVLRCFDCIWRQYFYFDPYLFPQLLWKNHQTVYCINFPNNFWHMNHNSSSKNLLRFLINVFNFLGVYINMNIKKTQRIMNRCISVNLFPRCFFCCLKIVASENGGGPLCRAEPPTWDLGTFDLCDTSGWIGDWYGWYGWIAIWKKTTSWVKLWMIQIYISHFDQRNLEIVFVKII